MRRLSDTIVAPITGAGPAPVAVVRLSGASAWEIAAQVFTPWPDRPVSHRAYYGLIAQRDEGLALVFEGGRGFTGEPAVEFSVHGSLAAVRSVVDACLEAGARSAEPGEFTYRAFLNGKIDLIEAEGIRDAIEAKTERQLLQTKLLRSGGLSAQVREIVVALQKVLAAVEASVDFSEEIGDLDRDAAAIRLRDASAKLDSLLATARPGRILRQGLRIALVGRPNAGKSSLLNALAGIGRSIVTEVPGTTRDYIEETVELGGVPCVLIDTAGLREPNDPVEAEGVALTRRWVESADVVAYVYDASAGLNEDDAELLRQIDRELLMIANKTDLRPGFRAPDGHIAVSAKFALGLEAISRWCEAFSDSDLAATTPLVQGRHEPHLRRANEAVQSSLEALFASVPDDLVAVGLVAAIDELGRITGESADEDMVDRIFSDFCIGK